MHSILIRNGYITVKNPLTGGHRTFQIRTQPGDAKFAPGRRIVMVLNGSSNDSEGSYRTFGFVIRERISGEFSVHVFRKLQGQDGKASAYDGFARILAETEKYSKSPFSLEYRFEAHCRRCNRVLTTPESIESGIGPECAKKGQQG